MANSPIETDAFRYAFRFLSLGLTDLYYISEPDGMDAARFTLKQKEGKFGRSRAYMADDKKVFTFWDCSVEKFDFEQVQRPDGYTSYYADHGLHWILETDRQFGYEGKIEFLLIKNGVEFVVGILSMASPDTDGLTFYSCNIIQDDIVSAYDKHADTSLDLLGTKNVRNETITPAPKTKILRKAVPLFAQSLLKSTGETELVQAFIVGSPGVLPVYFNKIKVIEQDGVKNTMTWFEDYSQYHFGDGSNFVPNRDTFTILKAKRKTSNIVVKFTLNLRLSLYDANFGNNDRNIFKLHCFKGDTGDFDTNWPGITVAQWTSDLLGDDTGIYTQDVQTVIEVPFDNLEIDGKIWAVFSFNASSSLPIYQIDFKDSTCEISATSTSLNTVLEGVRLIDALKQGSKFINDIPVDAPRWDIGGEFYNNVIFNKAAIGDNKTLPFTTTFKDLFESVEEVCGDFETRKDKIFVGQFPDFYQNVEIGVFQEIPSGEYREAYNERFKLNLNKFGYKTFEQDRTSTNTSGDIHTDSERIIPNEKVQNKKEISLGFVRSGFSQQVAVDLEINQPTTSTDADDDVYIVDVVELPDNSFYEFSATLLIRILDGKLQILNRNQDGDTEDVIINWLILGFKVGDTFYITGGANVGDYIVSDITRNILTLTPVNPATLTVQGNLNIKLKWFYTDVDFVTRTNEGFTLIEGIQNPQYYANLLYSIRRNLVHWEPYLNSACSYSQTKEIVLSKFKNNVPLRTQYQGGQIYEELASMPVSGLKPRIVTAKTIESECVATFEQVLAYMEAYKTVRGFIRIIGIDGRVKKGFSQEFNHEWATNRITFNLEQKYEEENLKIDLIGGQLLVNDAPYNLNGTTKWYIMANDYFQAFDEKSRPICNKYNYKFVVLNGIKYNSADELLIALENL